MEVGSRNYKVEKTLEAGRQHPESRRAPRRSPNNFQMIMIFAEEDRRRDLTGARVVTFAALR